MATKRRRSAMVEIQDEQSKQVTFSKRRKTLFNKVAELALLTGAQVAIIAFSPGGRPFVFAHPSVDDLVDAYLATSTTGMSTSTTFLPGGSEQEPAESTFGNLQFGCDIHRGIEEEKFMNRVFKEHFKIGHGVDRDQYCESVVLASDRDRVLEELEIDDDILDHDDQYCDPLLFSDDDRYGKPVLFSDDDRYSEPVLFSNDDRYCEPVLFSDDDQYGEPVLFSDDDRYSEPVLFSDDDQYGKPVLFSDDDRYCEPVLFSDDDQYGEPVLFSDDDRYCGSEIDHLPLIEEHFQLIDGESPSLKDDISNYEMHQYCLESDHELEVDFTAQLPSQQVHDGYRVEYFPEVDEDAAFEYLQFDDNYAFDQSESKLESDYSLWDQYRLF
ncbi:hypothetical protein H6P81_010097 [Aristolochia fimbriata]|uniref:MADS-box domain-containing protein n=1 Tax=Aristolochia fimbriata TaxID=158543 RepID=A0AAV7ER79_ARIFI|nr:hypothetical protein H6P81_010097 [Aristolochia fimbriata]